MREAHRNPCGWRETIGTVRNATPAQVEQALLNAQELASHERAAAGLRAVVTRPSRK